MKPFLLVLALCCGWLWSTAQPAENWELVRTGPGINAYTRVVEGKLLREYKVVAVVDAPFDTVVRYMRDGNLFALWVGKAQKEYKLLNIREDGSVIFYVVIPTPLLVQKRDIVIQSDFGEMRDGNFISKVHAVPEAYPLQPKRVRMSQFDALWYVHPAVDGKVEISYRGSADPAGAIPARFANRVMADNPFETVSALKQVLEKRR